MDANQLPALAQFNRVTLLDGATPIQRLHRLEQVLGKAAAGIRLFVKRDDLMGLGGGGNKVRKLEFLIGAAQADSCDTLIATGGLQSNHVRLAAAAAARLGLACEAVLRHVVAREDDHYRRSGNVLLDRLFGATIHELSGEADADAFIAGRVDLLREQGRRAYVMGMGGSSPTGALGYAACAAEVAAQEIAMRESFTSIILPNGSSGTHAGLVAGMAAMGRDPKQIRSFAVLTPAPATRSRTHDLARATLALLRDDASIDSESIDVDGDQLGAGYGVPTEAMIEAVQLMARTEGLLIDPVYGGKAFAGLLADLRNGVYRSGDAILFLMTGGAPGLFAYRPAFDPS